VASCVVGSDYESNPNGKIKIELSVFSHTQLWPRVRVGRVHRDPLIKYMPFDFFSKSEGRYTSTSDGEHEAAEP
jgi:hypothetical protein